MPQLAEMLLMAELIISKLFDGIGLTFFFTVLLKLFRGENCDREDYELRVNDLSVTCFLLQF